MPAIRIEIRGQSFDAPLPETPVRIGRGEGADLRIQGDGVAAEHCVLEPLGGGRTKLKDLGSGQGTLVNGVVAKQISLGDGDVIQIGEARITYLAHAAGAPAPAAPAKPAQPAQPAKPAVPAQPAKAAKPAKPTPPAKPAQPAPVAEPAEALEPAEATSPAPAAEAGSLPPARTEGARRGTKRKVPMVGILAGVLILVGVFFAVSGLDLGGDPSFDGAVTRARRAYDAQDYDAARAAFRDVIARAPEGKAKEDAKAGLALVAAIEAEMDLRLERMQGERLELTPQQLAAERRRFLASYGEGEAPRFDAARAAVLRAQAEWKTQNLDAARALAASHAEAGAFAAARDAWETLAARAPAAIDVTAEVAEAVEDLEAAADAKADELIARAAAWNQAGTPYRSVKLFEDVLKHYVGFEAEARMRAAQAAAVAARNKPIEFTPTRPGPDRPRPPSGTDTPPTQPGTEPEPAPPTDAEADAAAAAQAEALLASVQEDVRAARFRDAAAALLGKAQQLAPGAHRTRLEAIADDYGRAGQAKDALLAHIQANADRYRGVRIAPRLRVDLVDADAEYLHAKVTGGRSKHAWARLPSGAWVELVGRMRPDAAEAVPAAVLLHVLARDPDAERLLVAAVEKGADAGPVFALLARWRGIDVPEGGFVVHAGRYVTPAERDHLVREEQIAAALAQLDSRKPEERAAAAKELLAIGEPARERFGEALTRRRAFLLDEIARSKSFTSGKYKAKLLQLLDERRKHALELIYDAQAYPYPNPGGKNQGEVEARVDKVREVWERPFDLVSQWDKKLQEGMEGLTEVDSLLAEVVSGYRPDLSELKDRINKAIDVPSSADGSTREYSLKVLVYNTTVDTTAGPEEKANVRSVNDYRMMMGLVAVKIDEKLVRAARGHSRHMATNGYFAHDVPAPYATPQNRSPGIRAKQQGFGGGVGENIARGPGTGHGAFLAWFRSSGHHRNMVGRGWLVMGCGRANQSWWTQLFGGGSKSLTPPDPLPPPEAPFAPDPASGGPGRGNGGGGSDDAE